MRNTLRAAWCLSLTFAAALFAGCGGPTPASGPAKIAAVRASSVPDKAMVSLARLTPVLARPVNPPAPTSVPASGPSTAPMLTGAEAKMAARDFSSALEILDRAVGFEPDNPRVRKDLGLTYVGLSNYGRALENLQKSAAAAPDDLEVQVLTGKLLVVRGQPDAAIQAFRTALLTSRAKPQDPLTGEAMLRLAEMLARTGYTTAALEAYDRLGDWIESYADSYTASPALQPLLLQPETLMARRGELLLRLDQPAKAADLLTKAYASDHANADTACLLADALIRAKRYDQAQTLILELASQPAQQAQVVALAASLATAAGNPQLPSQIWQAYLAGGKKDTTLALAMAEVALKLKAMDQAQEILQSALLKQPGSLGINRALVDLMVAAGRYDIAMLRLAVVVGADANQAIEAGKTLRQISASAPADFHRTFARQIDADNSPSSAPAHYLAGLLATIRGDQSLAAAQYDKAAADDGRFLLVYDAMLNLYIEQRRSDDARKVLDRVAKLDEARCGYFKAYLRGRYDLAEGKVDQAITELQSSCRQRDDYLPALILLAHAYVDGSDKSNDRSAEAARTLLDALRVDPDNPDVNRFLLTLLLKKNQLADADQLVRQLLDRRPQSIVARVLHAQVLLAENRKAEAQALLDQLKKDAPRNPDVRLLDFRMTYEGRLLALQGDQWQQAVEKARAILRDDGANETAFSLLAALLNQPGRWAQAAEIWGKVYDETGRPLYVAKEYAYALSQAGKSEQAAAMLQSVLQSNPRDGDLRRALLDALEQLKRYDQAAALMEQWLRDAPDDQVRQSYRQMLLKFYQDAGQYDKAQKLLDESILLAVDPQKILQLRGQKLKTFAKAKQYDPLVAYGRKWIDEIRRQDSDSDPLLAGVQLFILSVLQDAQQYERALTLVDEWAAKDAAKEPKNERWPMLRIMLLGRSGQLEKGRQAAMELISRLPDRREPREALIQMYSDAGKIDQAMAALDSWLASSESKPSASAPAPLSPEILDFCRLEAVHLLYRQQKYQQAIERIDRYLPQYPAKSPEERATLVSLQTTKATCYGEMGQFDKQIALLEGLLRDYPDDAFLKNDLGYLYADRGIHLDKAERLLREAVEASDRPSPAVKDSQAWVWYKQGKFNEAGRVFDAVLSRPDEFDSEELSPVIYDHAGDTAYRLGNAQKATELWTQAVQKAKTEKSPDSETRKVIPSAAAKIEAVKKNTPAAVAPLGEGVGQDKPAK